MEEEDLGSDNGSGRLWADVKSLVISDKLHPVEGYEFPQETVAQFWKDVFEEKGINVFGMREVPSGVSVLQTDFQLPDDPPDWLFQTEE